MNTVIAAAIAGLPASAQKLVKHLQAKARAMPSLAAMKTTKLQDADCANKDVYEMILGKFTGLESNLTRDKVCPSLSPPSRLPSLSVTPSSIISRGLTVFLSRSALITW